MRAKSPYSQTMNVKKIGQFRQFGTSIKCVAPPLKTDLLASQQFIRER